MFTPISWVRKWVEAGLGRGKGTSMRDSRACAKQGALEQGLPVRMSQPQQKSQALRPCLAQSQCGAAPGNDALLYSSSPSGANTEGAGVYTW